MENSVYTISKLNSFIKEKFSIDNSLKRICIKGEISNFKPNSSGHLYFILKDEKSKIKAVMFKSKARNLKFSIENGMSVLVRGDITVYQVDGVYQIQVDTMEQDGMGNLFLQYEKMHEKLRSEGLFDQNHKKPIPTYPRSIALLTAYPSDALMDVVRTIKNRYPLIKISIYPIPVQGQQIYHRIISVLQHVDQQNYSTIIMTRGGGSIEDLWNFNEEPLVRAIYHCITPIICAIGHESNFSLAEFAADLRSSTPTAAAIAATPNIVELQNRVATARSQLVSAIQHKHTVEQNRLQFLKQQSVFCHPQRMIDDRLLYLNTLTDNVHRSKDFLLSNTKNHLNRVTQDFNHLLNVFTMDQRNIIDSKRMQLITSMNQYTKTKQYNLDIVSRHLNPAIEQYIDNKRNYFTQITAIIDNVSPLKILSRGYSIISHNEQIIKSVDDVQPNDHLIIRVDDGIICATTKDKEKHK